MAERVQKEKPAKQERKAEPAATKTKGRTEERQQLLDDTEALLDEIDELVRQGELVDATQYLQRGGE
jgi:hypothetical protein